MSFEVGTRLEPDNLWGAWTLDPGILLGIVTLVTLYVVTLRRLWGSGRRGAGITVGQAWSFAAGVVALVVAVVSPLDALGEALFAAHMTQHLLLALVAAPLLLAGRVHLVAVAVVGVGARRRYGRKLARLLRRIGPGGLVLAVAFHVGVTLAWHVPVLYDLAVSSAPVHALEHLSMLAGGLVFWAALGASGPRPVAAAGIGAFGAAFAMILLSALLTFAPEPWYGAHETTAASWGLTPLQDQQLAAAIMWIPGGFVYLGAGVWAMVRWLRHDQRRIAALRTP